jgi:hypothetical protein
MATLGTQNISTSYSQVLKTYGSNIVDTTLRNVSSGDEAGVSALQISTTGVKSTGTFAVDGAATFGSSITASTGTSTIGTISANTATIGTLSTLNGLGVTTTATLGTAKIGASGPSITKVSYGTAAFTSATVQQYNSADSTTGTFALTGAALGDIVFGSINSIGSATGTYNLAVSFYPTATDVVRYSIQNQGSTAGTIPSGIIHATAMRFTA